MASISTIQKRDLIRSFHPMANFSELNESGPLMVVRGEGIHLYDEHDNQYIDGLAGLWCTSLGYANEEIAETAYEQMKKLSYQHLFKDKSSVISMELAEKRKKWCQEIFLRYFRLSALMQK